MPNYSLVSGAAFKARSFDDLIKPYLLYTKEYREQEDALNDLALKTDTWDKLLDKQDTDVYTPYKSYSDSIQTQINEISKNGLTQNSRQQLNKLKRKYTSEIVPIENAYNRRKEQIEEQRKLSMTNPAMIYNWNAKDKSVSDYLKNPTLGYEGYNGALLTQQVSTMAKALSEELRDSIKTGNLGGYTRYFMQRYGYRPEEIYQALTNRETSNPILKYILEDTVEKSGLSAWGQGALDAGYHWAGQGLWSAIGKNTLNTYQDEWQKLRDQWAHESATPKVKAGLTGDSDDDIDGILGRINPVNIYSSADRKTMSEDAKLFQKLYNKGYIFKDSKDGSYRMKKHLLELANEVEKIPISRPLGDVSNESARLWKHPEIRSLLEKIGVVSDEKTGMFTGLSKRGVIDAFKKKIDFDYDTNAETAYKHIFSDSDQQQVKSALSSIPGTYDIMDYKGLGQGYGFTESLSREDFADFKVVSSESSKYGTYYTLVCDSDKNSNYKKGDLIQIAAPGVNPQQEATVKRYHESAEDVRIKMTKLKPEYDKILNLGVPYDNLTQEQKNVLVKYAAGQQAYAQLLWKAEQEAARIYQGYKTSDITIK